MFHLEKLKVLTCVHEYAVTVSNQLNVLTTLGDPVKLWESFKRKTLQLGTAIRRGWRGKARKRIVQIKAIRHELPCLYEVVEDWIWLVPLLVVSARGVPGVKIWIFQ